MTKFEPSEHAKLLSKLDKHNKQKIEYQDQIDDDAQFEAEQEALSDAVFEMEEDFYETVASNIACEVEDFKNINWDAVEEAVQDAKNVTKYIEEAEWEKAHDIMIWTLM